jgi:hypothetical protein
MHCHRATLLILLFAMLAVSHTGSCQAASSIQTAGRPQIVFDTRSQACESIDIPDSSARAFRDDQNHVHLFASHYVTRAMVGPTLGEVKHDCRIVYQSRKDANPGDFSDYDWLAAFYTPDGHRVAALVHNEYHGWTHPGMCEKPAAKGESGHCWWNTVDFMTSDDGGESFTIPSPPHNLVASAPRPYDKNNDQGATGFFQPSNIVSQGGYFYAMINVWHDNDTGQKSGACLIRTQDVFDPASWRAWQGTDFTMAFNDPYGRRSASGSGQACTPVYGGHAEGLVFNPARKTFVLSESTSDTRYGEPGLYLSYSKDMIHWQHPVLAIGRAALQAADGPGKWTYGYFSLLDPSSTDHNFMTISDKPYAYYIRFDGEHPPLTRALMRWQLHLAIVE